MSLMTIEEAYDRWPKGEYPEMYDLIYGDNEPIVITPDDWEIDVPDLDWSRFGVPVENPEAI